MTFNGSNLLKSTIESTCKISCKLNYHLISDIFKNKNFVKCLSHHIISLTPKYIFDNSKRIRKTKIHNKYIIYEESLLLKLYYSNE